MRFIYPLFAGALLAAPLAAQTATDSAVIKARQRVQDILGIPRKADEARRAGVPDSTVRGVLDILVKQRVPADEAGTILTTEAEAAREHGPTDNFGAFVQSQLAAGKRGQELAAAIRAEHAARGKGRPANAGRDDAARGKRPEAAGAKRPDAATGGRPEQPAGKKPAADTTRGKRPGNPNAKHP